MIDTLKRFVVAYIVLAVCFTALVFSASVVSTHAVWRFSDENVAFFRKEGTYPSFGFPWRRITLDNFADAIAVNIAYSIDSTTPLKSSLANVMQYGEEDTISPISNLESYVKRKTVTPVGYERYWHGYLFYIRPLLALMPYSDIRIILTLVLYAGIAALLHQTWKHVSRRLAIGFLLGFALVDALFVGLSIEFSGVFLTGIGGGLYLIYHRKHPQHFPLIFFVIGACASFVDLLSAPLVALAIPLFLALHLQRKQVRAFFMLCSAWSIGYLGLWATKWVITDILFNQHAIYTGLAEVVNRTVNTPDAAFSHIATLKINMQQLIGYDKRNKIALASAAVLFIVFLFTFVDRHLKNKKQLLGWAGIALLPYFWYLIAANHSYLHVWFTYRNQFMTVVAAWLSYSSLIDWKSALRIFRR